MRFELLMVLYSSILSDELQILLAKQREHPLVEGEIVGITLRDPVASYAGGHERGNVT